MPALKNPRHEQFAQLLAGGGLSEVGAYEQAGYKPNRSHASRLVAVGSVQRRVAELQAAAAEATGITLEGHLRRLADLSAGAEAAGQYGAAISAEMARGKVAGFYVERTINDNLNRTYVVRIPVKAEDGEAWASQHRPH